MKVSEIVGLCEDRADMSALDDTTFDSIKHEVQTLAKDQEKEYPTALALVHDAYEIAQVERPTPSMRDGWIQYETIISLAVEYLAKFRPDGDWRLTTATSKPRTPR
jgi:hypothetical protein